MPNPLWFRLIERWVPEHMGQTGITLPFLAGAIARQRGVRSVSVDELHSLMQQLIDSPVNGFAVSVSRCPNIKAPVLSMSSVSKAMPFDGCVFLDTNENPVLGFSCNVQSSLGGFGSSNPGECLERLISDAAPHCSIGNFSRRFNDTRNEYEYAEFSPKDEKYIDGQIEVGKIQN